MTNIDLKRLAVDREYWDSVAPEGSTHFWPFGRGVFYVRNEDGTLSIFDSKCKGGLGVAHSSKLKEPDMIPRPPKKAQEGEWQDGLPPVGVECEINPHGEWFKVTVHGYGKNKFLAEISPGQTDSYGDAIVGEYAYWTSQTEFRPIPTKAQRQREEVLDMLGEAASEFNVSIDCSAAIVAAADAILSRYNLEPKP